MTEVATTTGNEAVTKLNNLQSGVGIMSTIEANTFEEKRELLNALTNAQNVADHLDEVINLVNVIGQAVVVNDAVTGEDKDVVRTVLVDADGNAYAAVSDGILGSLRDIFAIMGQPNTWSGPLPVKVIEMKGSRPGRKFFKIVIA